MIILSIIIVNWNTKDLLQQCLRSVYKNIPNMKFEVYVVDNNSSDSSPEMIKKVFPQVKLIENSRNDGFARANNKAIRKSRGRYVLLLNSDTIVLGDALIRMVEFADEHKEVGVLGCKLVNKNGTLQYSAARFPTLATVILGGNIVPRVMARLFRIKRFPGQTYLNEKDHNKLQEVDWVVGACILVRSEAIKEAGLLDENLFVYGEEIEWCIRLKKAGWSVFYFPDAQIIHYGGGSSKGQSQVKSIMYRRTFAERYIYHKHHNGLSSSIYDLLITIMAMVKLLLWGSLLLVLRNKHKVLAQLSYHQGVLKSVFGPKRITEE